MMKKQLFLIAGIIMISVLSLKIYYLKFRGPENTYAIINALTGTAFRPEDANCADGTRIVANAPQQWKCFTWVFYSSGRQAYHLQNRFTGKSFEPAGPAGSGTALVQHSFRDTLTQQWLFEQNSDGTYLIKLKGTNLCVTQPETGGADKLILSEQQGTERQHWKLIPQNPMF
jgi:hypothetical protein